MSIRKKFEFLGLGDGRARVDLAAADDVADLEMNDIASSEFAVDRDIEKNAIVKPSIVVEIEADAPYLLQLQRASLLLSGPPAHRHPRNAADSLMIRSMPTA